MDGQQTLLHQVFHLVRPAKQALAQKSPQMGAQLREEAVVSRVIPVQSTQKKIAQYTFSITCSHRFLILIRCRR